MKLLVTVPPRRRSGWRPCASGVEADALPLIGIFARATRRRCARGLGELGRTRTAS